MDKDNKELDLAKQYYNQWLTEVDTIIKQNLKIDLKKHFEDFNKIEWKQAVGEEIKKAFKKFKEDIDKINDVLKNIPTALNLDPYIDKELEKLHKQNKNLDITHKEVVQHMTFDGKPKNTNIPNGEIFEYIINTAVERFKMEHTKPVGLSYTRPDKLIMPTTKITSEMFNKHSTNFKANVNDTKKKTEVLVDCKVFVDVDKQPDIKLSKNLTAYDREVFNGYCSILEAGYTFCTSKQIYEAMTGKPSRSPQAEASVTKSMMKFMATIQTLDWTQHAKMKGLDPQKVKCIHINENMVYVEVISAIVNGKKVQGFHTIKDPLMLTYSKSVGQIVSVNKKYLQLPNVSNTTSNIKLKNHIVRRIESMKNKKSKQSNVIKFDTLFAECEIEVEGKTDAKRHRDSVFQILDDLQEIKYIISYKKNKKNKQFVSVEITPNPSIKD